MINTIRTSRIRHHSTSDPPPDSTQPLSGSTKRKAPAITGHRKRSKLDEKSSVELKTLSPKQRNTPDVPVAASKGANKGAANTINAQHETAEMSNHAVAVSTVADGPCNAMLTQVSTTIPCGCCGEPGHTRALDVQCSRCEQVRSSASPWPLSALTADVVSQLLCFDHGHYACSCIFTSDNSNQHCTAMTYRRPSLSFDSASTPPAPCLPRRCAAKSRGSASPAPGRDATSHHVIMSFTFA